MNFERITSTENPFYTAAVSLYKISFPVYEQREEASQNEMLTNTDYHFDVVCDNGKLIGEIFRLHFHKNYDIVNI